MDRRCESRSCKGWRQDRDPISRHEFWCRRKAAGVGHSLIQSERAFQRRCSGHWFVGRRIGRGELVSAGRLRPGSRTRLPRLRPRFQGQAFAAQRPLPPKIDAGLAEIHHQALDGEVSAGGGGWKEPCRRGVRGRVLVRSCQQKTATFRRSCCCFEETRSRMLTLPTACLTAWRIRGMQRNQGSYSSPAYSHNTNTSEIAGEDRYPFSHYASASLGAPLSIEPCQGSQ